MFLSLLNIIGSSEILSIPMALFLDTSLSAVKTSYVSISIFLQYFVP